MLYRFLKSSTLVTHLYHAVSRMSNRDFISQAVSSNVDITVTASENCKSCVTVIRLQDRLTQSGNTEETTACLSVN